MKIIAKFQVQLNGHVYARGEACEYNGPVTDRIAHNFTREDGEPLVKEGDQMELGLERGTGNGESASAEATADRRGTDETVRRTVDALKRDGICRQLDEMGVTYPAKAKTDYLARLLLASKGEIDIGELKGE